MRAGGGGGEKVGRRGALANLPQQSDGVSNRIISQI